MESSVDSALPTQFTWSGSRSSHGIDYEKDLALTLFVAASSEERQFRLAVEMNVAGKFDDAVLSLDDRKEVWLFQAKHSQTSNAKIEYQEFFPSSLEENSQFSLPMYIQSFRNVSQHSEFKNYKKRFIIFSNKSIDENTRKKLGKIMNINNCTSHDPLEKKVFTKSSEQFIPKAEQIQDLLDKVNELPVAIKDAIIELQKSGTVKSILRKYTTPLRSILEIDGSVRFSETFTGSEDNINQQWLWNELQRHFISQIGSVERLSEVVFNKKIDKRLLQNKSAETSFPRFIEESDLRNFFDCLVMCTDQPDELFQLRDNIIESIVKKWIHEKDRGLFNDRTKFHVIFEKAFGEWHMVTNLNGNQKPFLNSYEGNICVQKTKAELRRTLQNITDADFSNYVERRVVFQNEETDFTEEKFTSVLEQSPDRTDYYILIGKPGMGKSTFMKKITYLLQADFNKHVYLICLSRLFDNYKEGNDIFTLIKSALSQSIQQLVQHSLENFYQQCFILFDGFDEVDACHQDSVIKLIKETFCKNKICVFISGRNHVKESLEQALQVKALDLVPFFEDEQLSFLRNHWDIGSEIDEEDYGRFQRFAKRLLQILHDNIKSAYFRFTGLPLMVRMLAEVYKEKFEEYWSSTNENIAEILSTEDKFSVLSLYSNFVKISFNIFVKKIINEEGYKTVNSKVITFFEDNLKSFYRSHQLIAIKQLRIVKLQNYLSSNDSVSLLEKMQKNLDYCEKSLLIDASSKNQLQFTHLSYAEYFLSSFLYEHVSECETSLAIVLASYEVVRTCFFSMITENWDDSSLQLNTIIKICHQIPEIMYCACSDGDESILKELLKYHKAKVKFSSYYLISGGTLLHAAVKSKKENILKLILCDYQFGDCSHHEAKSDIMEICESVVDINTPDSRGVSPIHYAVSDGNKAFVKTLAQHGAHKNINAQDIGGNTILHIAARVGDSEMIRMLTVDYSANPKIRNHEGRTILHVAAARRDLMIVKLMITEFSCDCNAQDDYGCTPLHTAARSSTKEMVKMMIDQYSADYQIVNKEGRTVIHFAAKGSNIDVVRMLIGDYATDVNAQDYDGNTPILLAAGHSTREMVKMLIDQYSADYQIGNEDGRTIIHMAAKGDKMYIVKMLIDDYKLNVNAQDYDGNTPLHLAAEYGTKQMVKMLIDQYHADLKMANESGESPIHVATRKNNLGVVRMLIDDYLIDVNIKCDDGNTPLLYAALFDEWEMFKILINEYDADYTIANEDGQTVIHVAAKNGNMEILKMLMENYAVDVNVRDEDGNTPLYLAAMNGKWQVMDMLIKKYSADCKLANKKGQTLIHFTALTGNMDIVKMLINDYGIDINAQDNDGISALHLAVQYSTWQMVKILINRYSADYKAVSKNGNNLIHSAAKGFNKEIVEMLINDYAADVNAQDNHGNTPLHIAARHSTCEMVMMLISKYSADYKTANEYGKSLIHLAVEGGNMETVKMLLDDYEADVNAQDNDGNTPLHLAAEYSTLEMVMMLIHEYSANYKMANKYGKTLIHFAASGGNLEIIKMLIEDLKADVNAQDNDGNTPLYLVAEFSSWQSVKKLIDKHLADYKIANKYGQTLIHLAAEGGNKRIVKMLLDYYEENVNAQNNDGNTPLHLAVENSIDDHESNLGILKMLIEDFKADVNAQNNEGNTPLHFATTQGDRKMVKMLIDNYRANLSSANRSGQTLFHAASRSGQWDVVKMLLVDYSLDVNNPDGSGHTLLHLACELNNMDAVKMLINDHSADIKCVDNEGRSPSQVAAERGHWEVVDELARASISSLQE